MERATIHTSQACLSPNSFLLLRPLSFPKRWITAIAIVSQCRLRGDGIVAVQELKIQVPAWCFESPQTFVSYQDIEDTPTTRLKFRNAASYASDFDDLVKQTHSWNKSSIPPHPWLHRILPLPLPRTLEISRDTNLKEFILSFATKFLCDWVNSNVPLHRGLKTLTKDERGGLVFYLPVWNSLANSYKIF